MFPRTLLLFFAIHRVVLASIEVTPTTSATAGSTTFSKVGVILLVALCAALSVLIIIVPTLIFYKYYSKEKLGNNEETVEQVKREMKKDGERETETNN